MIGLIIFMVVAGTIVLIYERHKEKSGIKVKRYISHLTMEHDLIKMQQQGWTVSNTVATKGRWQNDNYTVTYRRGANRG